MKQKNIALTFSIFFKCNKKISAPEIKTPWEGISTKKEELAHKKEML